MTESYTIAVIGAGGKMGMRVSNNLVKTDHRVAYVENSPAGQERTREAGRELTEAHVAVADADIIVLAVPDLALGPVTADLVPQLKAGAIVLTLRHRPGVHRQDLAAQANRERAKAVEIKSVTTGQGVTPEELL